MTRSRSLPHPLHRPAARCSVAGGDPVPGAVRPTIGSSPSRDRDVLRPERVAPRTSCAQNELRPERGAPEGSAPERVGTRTRACSPNICSIRSRTCYGRSTTRTCPGARSRPCCRAVPRGTWQGRARPWIAVVERRWRRAGVEPQAAAVSNPTATRPLMRPDVARVPYAELHCHSNFSFLDGASHPEQLVEEAARLGLEALALTDHDGLYGVVRFAEAARARRAAHGVRRRDHPRRPVAAPLAGARSEARHAAPAAGGHATTSVTLPTRTASTCWSLADGPTGYARLARALSLGHLAGEKGAPQFTLPDLADAGAGHWWVLTGCRKGAVPAALLADGPRAAAARAASGWSTLFGRDRVVVELWDHGDPLDSARNDALAELAARHDVDVRRHQQRPLRHAGAAPAGHRRSPRCAPGAASTSSTRGCRPSSGAHLRSGAEQARRFLRYPGVVELAAEIGRAAAFDLSLVAPNLPPFPCPPGRRPPLTEMQYLRQLVEAGARRRYGERPADGEDLSMRARAWRTIDHELDVIEHLGFAGYFLVVWDIVEFCNRGEHLLPGSRQRGQQRGLLRARHHQGRRGVARPAVRAVPVARARRSARHRPRHRERPARGGHPVRVRPLRPAPRRAGRQRHHLPRPLGGARHGQGARLRAGPAGRVEQADRRVGPGRGHRPPRGPTAGRPRHPRSRCSSWRRRSRTCRATSASTRAAW